VRRRSEFLVEKEMQYSKGKTLESLKCFLELTSIANVFQLLTLKIKKKEKKK